MKNSIANSKTTKAKQAEKVSIPAVEVKKVKKGDKEKNSLFTFNEFGHVIWKDEKGVAIKDIPRSAFFEKRPGDKTKNVWNHIAKKNLAGYEICKAQWKLEKLEAHGGSTDKKANKLIKMREVCAKLEIELGLTPGQEIEI